MYKTVIKDTSFTYTFLFSTSPTLHNRIIAYNPIQIFYPHITIINNSPSIQIINNTLTIKSKTKVVSHNNELHIIKLHSNSTIKTKITAKKLYQDLCKYVPTVFNAKFIKKMNYMINVYRDYEHIYEAAVNILGASEVDKMEWVVERDKWMVVDDKWEDKMEIIDFESYSSSCVMSGSFE